MKKSIFLTSVAKNRALAGSYLMATVRVLNTVFSKVTISFRLTAKTIIIAITRNQRKALTFQQRDMNHFALIFVFDKVTISLLLTVKTTIIKIVVIRNPKI